MSAHDTLTRPFDRRAMVEALRSTSADGEPLDLVVVGGGITGAGVALDAAARGMRVALVERHDFGSGTSSKSSKMVHGGLRYLQNGDIRLVYEALHERTRLMRNAPHLVETLPFLIPVMTKDGVVSRKVSRALGSALWMYDATGGWRIGKLHHRVSKAAATRYFPTARDDALSGGYLYFDAEADDARLTLAIARTAADRGAIAVNRAEVVGLSGGGGTAHAVTVAVDGRSIVVRARAVVVAAGVWTDDVRALDEGQHPGSIRPAKGVHAAVPWELVRNQIAVIVPIRSDRRSLFLVPWGRRPDGTFRHTYFGTTDTDYDGPLDGPTCDGDDLDYLLTALNAAIEGTIDRSDVTGVWAGLRPLVKHGEDEGGSTTDLSRTHRVEVAPSGVIRVTGGKLTTYRRMAEDTVDLVVDRLGAARRQRRHPTRRLRLRGAEGGRPPGVDRLARRYGTDAPRVHTLVALDADLAEPLVPGQPYLRAEAVYAARDEMATTLEDVLCRRTRAHLFDREACRAVAPQVADLLAGELGWDAAERERQLTSYLDLCTAEERALEHHANAAH